jgi:LPS-assembly lipoprotein
MLLADRRRVVTRLALVAPLLLLGGCLQPVYAPAGRATPQASLQTIEVADIKGRLGHYLKTSLQFALGGGTLPNTPVYRLVAAPTSNNRIAAVDRGIAVADNVSAVVDVSYQLIEISSGNPLLTSSVQAIASFGRSTQRFANIQAQQDAEERAAKLAAEQIRTEIVAFFLSTGR